MCALSECSVVSEKVEALLRVGLGLGKVMLCGHASASCVSHITLQADLTLARYVYMRHASTTQWQRKKGQR